LFINTLKSDDSFYHTIKTIFQIKMVLEELTV